MMRQISFTRAADALAEAYRAICHQVPSPRRHLGLPRFR